MFSNCADHVVCTIPVGMSPCRLGLGRHHGKEEVICHARACFGFGFGLGSVSSRGLRLCWPGCNRSRCTLALRFTFRLRSLTFAFLSLRRLILFGLPSRLTPFDFILLPCGPRSAFLSFRLHWMCAFEKYSGGLSHRLHICLAVALDDTLDNCAVW